MSVNRTVASTRSISLSSALTDRMNRSISSSIGSGFVCSMIRSRPGSSTYFAPGIRSARNGPPSVRLGSDAHSDAPGMASTSVGACTLPRTDRTSIANHMSMNSSAAAGTRRAASTSRTTRRTRCRARARAPEIHPLLRLLERAPSLLHVLTLGEESLLLHADRVVGRPRAPRVRPVEDQSLHALRVRRREERRQRTAVGVAHHDRSVGANGVQHGPQIVGTHLEIGVWLRSDNPVPRLSNRTNRENDASPAKYARAPRLSRARSRSSAVEPTA